MSFRLQLTLVRLGDDGVHVLGAEILEGGLHGASTGVLHIATTALGAAVGAIGHVHVVAGGAGAAAVIESATQGAAGEASPLLRHQRLTGRGVHPVHQDGHGEVNVIHAAHVVGYCARWRLEGPAALAAGSIAGSRALSGQGLG